MTRSHGAFLQRGVACLSFLLAVVPHIVASREGRTIGAWMQANGDYNTSRQLLNSSSWGGLIDVVQMNRCGWEISGSSTSPPTMQVNLTTLYSDNCQQALHILKEKDIDVHMWIGGASMDLVHNHDAFIASTIDLIQRRASRAGGARHASGNRSQTPELCAACQKNK